MSNPKCPWCGENHPTEMIRLYGYLVTTCPRLGVHEAVMISRPDLVAMARTPKCLQCKVRLLCRPEEAGECSDRPACDDRDSFRQEYMCKPPEPVAQVRLEDGSQVVAYAPVGFEVRAFTAEDLDERGMPRGMR